MGLPEVIKALRPTNKVRKRSLWGLTPSGKKKAEEYGAQGIRWHILNYLDDNGESSLRDICETTHIKEDDGREILRGLHADGLIMPVAHM
jgi:hypothetical protein